MLRRVDLTRGVAMKLCGFEVGLDSAAVPDRRTLRRRIAAAAGGCRGRAARRSARRSAIPFIFKSSYDKANRSSARVVSRPGMEEGLRILAEVRSAGRRAGADRRAHGGRDSRRSAAVVDVLQTPAFLCRQTDFIQAVARAGKPVNIKKGQFLAPEDMKQVVAKAQRGERRRQHHGLRARRVVRLPQPRLRHALAGDHARHRLPGRVRRDAFRCSCRAGRARRAAVSASSCRCWRARRSPPAWRAFSWRRIRNPEKALSDGPNAWPLGRMRALLETLKELDAAVEARRLSGERTDAARAS